MRYNKQKKKKHGFGFAFLLFFFFPLLLLFKGGLHKAPLFRPSCAQKVYFYNCVKPP